MMTKVKVQANTWSVLIKSAAWRKRYPTPLEEPIVSATSETRQPKPNARRAPEKKYGSIVGREIFVITFQSGIRTTRASSMKSAFTVRVPCQTLVIIKGMAVMNTTKIVVALEIPNQMMAKIAQIAEET